MILTTVLPTFAGSSRANDLPLQLRWDKGNRAVNRRSSPFVFARDLADLHVSCEQSHSTPPNADVMPAYIYICKVLRLSFLHPSHSSHPFLDILGTIKVSRAWKIANPLLPVL